MERYLVFYGDIYYPSAGFGDFIGDFHNKNDAFDAINHNHFKVSKRDQKDFDKYRYGSVYDSETKTESFINK